MNFVLLIGNVGKDAETKFLPSGQVCSKFPMATTETFWSKTKNQREERTQWHNVVMWGKERVAEFLKKGKKVIVKGKIETRSYEKDGRVAYITEIVADEVTFISTGRVDHDDHYDEPKQRASSGETRQAKKKEPPADDFDEIGEDDIPF